MKLRLLSFSFLIVVFAAFMLQFFGSCQQGKHADIEVGTFLEGDTLHTVRIYGTMWNWDERIPGDSTASTHVDIDKDGKADLKIWLSHEPWSPTPHVHYKYKQKIISLDKRFSIATNGSDGCKFFKKGELISRKELWKKEAFNIGSLYIGIRIKDSGHDKYGWLNAERINEDRFCNFKYAINHSGKIYAGQTQ
ncbi:MAG: hypothetical protein ACFHU9_04495 [Fluviicola sp.]